MYEASENTTSPDIGSIANDVTGQIVFTGTNFFDTGHTANASYGGTYADTIVIDSATQVTATWTYGLPPLGTAVVPELWFDKTDNREVHYASIANTTSLNKTLDVTGATTGLSCSFAGGCNLEVNAQGLSTILKSDPVNNFISVCDERCVFLDL
jgi:hypothetical protein